MRKPLANMEHVAARSVALPLDNRGVGPIERVIGEVSGAIQHALARHRAAFILFVVLQLGDLVSTHLSYRVGGWEANPIAASVLQTAGEGGLYALKLAWVAGILGVAILLEKRYARVWRAIYIVNAVMLAVVISNSLQAALTALSL